MPRADRMVITIDVKTGKVLTVGSGPDKDDAETVNDKDLFKKEGPKKDFHRMDHTAIVCASSSPTCVYFYQRGRGWRKVCS